MFVENYSDGIDGIFAGMIPKDSNDLEFFREEFLHYVDSLEEDQSFAFPTWADPNEDWSKKVLNKRLDRLQFLVSVYFVVLVVMILVFLKH